MIQTSSMSLACNVLTAFSMPRSSLPGTGGKPKPTFALPQQDGDLVAKGDTLKFQAGAATKAEAAKRTRKKS
jgi:hypothetical protein